MRAETCVGPTLNSFGISVFLFFGERERERDMMCMFDIKQIRSGFQNKTNKMIHHDDMVNQN